MDVAAAGVGTAYELNKEGEDLKVPLPSEWTKETLKTLKVTLYGGKINPPVCKIRFFLKQADIKFEFVECSKKPNSEYTKIPVLDIADRQINDSYIIVKNLAPIIKGDALTQEETDFENLITFAIMIALEKHAAGSCSMLAGCGKVAGGLFCCLLHCFGPCICCCASSIFKNETGPRKDNVLKALQEYGNEVSERLGTKKFFGGEEPGINDVSLWGTLLPFMKAAESRCSNCCESTADAFLHTDNLIGWRDNMQVKFGNVDIW